MRAGLPIESFGAGTPMVRGSWFANGQRNGRMDGKAGRVPGIRHRRHLGRLLRFLWCSLYRTRKAKPALKKSEKPD